MSITEWFKAKFNKAKMDFKSPSMKTKIIGLLMMLIIIVVVIIFLVVVVSVLAYVGYYSFMHIKNYIDGSSGSSVSSVPPPSSSTTLQPAPNSTGNRRWSPAGNRNSNTLHYWGSTGQVIGTQQDRSDNYYMGGIDTTPYEAFSNIACDGNSCNGGKYGNQNDDYDTYGMNVDLKSDHGFQSNLRRSAVRGGMRLGDDNVASLWRTTNGYEMNGISRNIGDFYRNQ